MDLLNDPRESNHHNNHHHGHFSYAGVVALAQTLADGSSLASCWTNLSKILAKSDCFDNHGNQDLELDAFLYSCKVNCIGKVTNLFHYDLSKSIVFSLNMVMVLILLYCTVVCLDMGYSLDHTHPVVEIGFVQVD